MRLGHRRFNQALSVKEDVIQIQDEPIVLGVRKRESEEAKMNEIIQFYYRPG